MGFLRLHGREHIEIQLHADAAQVFVEGRYRIAAGEVADDFVVGPEAAAFELEELEELHRAVFDTGDFGDAGDAARAVGQARLLHYHVDRRGDLLANRRHRNIHAGHERHDFESAHDVARAVGVRGSQGTVVASVHGLEHVEGFATAAFADDDAIGPHAQAVAHEIADGDHTLAFDIRRPRFERYEMRRVELELRRVFDGDDAFAARNEIREDVEERGLARARAAGDHDVLAALDADLQEFEHRGVRAAEADVVLDAEQPLVELADGDGGSAQGQWRNDGVHARAVLEARVHHRRGFVDAT